MANLNYWADRAAKEQWQIYNASSVNTKELLEAFRKAEAELDAQIIEIGKELAQTGTLSRSKSYRGKQLLRIRQSVRETIKKLGKAEEKTGKKAMLTASKELFKKTEEATGIPIVYNEEAMQRLMQVKWHGDNFSGRVWQNKKKLVYNIEKSITKGLETGKSIAEMAIDLNKAMGTGLAQSARLVRTETMHHLNDANLAAMKESGVKYIEEVVTLDERTSDECRHHHGVIHPIDKAPHLPRHPNCRCVLVPKVRATDKDVKKTQDELKKRQEKAKQQKLKKTTTTSKGKEQSL